MTRRGWLLFAAMSLIWGIPYLLIKIAVTDVDPLIVAFGRTLIGALLLLPIALYRRALGPVFRRWKVLLVYTLVEISGPWLLLGHAETRLNSSTAGLLLAVVPMIAAVILTVMGHDRFDVRRVAGLLIGFTGVGFLVGLDIHFDDLIAVGTMMLVAVGYAVGPIIINRRLSDLPPMGVVTASLIVAAVVYAPFTLLVGPVQLTADAAWSIAGLGVICTAVAFLGFFALIAEAGPARATVITYINPAVAITLGVLLLGEPFTAGMAIGFPLVILGSVLATARVRRRRPDAGPDAAIAAADGTTPARPSGPAESDEPAPRTA
ncbi:DMT family transporter [Nakamurella sp.]|uniref:DMT family transporter n=1 Tax=Nakamurella sp. TaxID=1869182 RepID=UPI0037833956